MQNFSLLNAPAAPRNPFSSQRGMSATLDEFLMAAEYILSEGNYNVMLCERGVRTFSDFSRNTLDLAVVPAVKKRSHLPIFVDPSHGTGKRHKVLRSPAPLSPSALMVSSLKFITKPERPSPMACSPPPRGIHRPRRRNAPNRRRPPPVH